MEEPSFRDSKVIFTLFDQIPTKELQENIVDKLMLKGIERSDVETFLPEGATYKDFCKLAISYSDGIIQGSENIDPELLAYVQEKGIPMLEYQPAETAADAINDFYDKIWSQS